VSAQTEPASTVLAAPLSYAQQRLWLLERLAPGTSTYNVPYARRLFGTLDADALQRAVEDVVRRHEVLRTRFESVRGEPTQIVGDGSANPVEIIDLSAAPAAEAARFADELVVERAWRPFDLAAGAPLRVLLLRFSATEHVLLTVMHHIVTDQWSIDIFNRELSASYEARCQGTSAVLPQLEIQYADYAVWQRESLDADALDPQLRAWREALDGAPSRIELLTDRPRTLEAGWEGRSRSIALPVALADGLRAIARRNGATLFMTMLAAVDVLLARYSGQSDLVVGIPVTNRTRPELEPLIGFFVNTLAIRAAVGDDTGFEPLLQRVRDAALRGYENQDVPFDQVVADLHPERSPGDTPLVNVMFDLVARGEGTWNVGSLRAEPYPIELRTAKFDLSFTVIDAPAGLRCAINYRSALFDDDTIERMLTNFATLLDGIVAAPQAPVATLPLLADAERERVVRTFNAAVPAVATIDRARIEGRTLLDLLEAQAARTPNAVAVESDERADAAQHLTYAALHAQADGLAAQLRALGVGPGVGVAIFARRSCELAVALVGVLKAGGYYVPLDPDYPAERLAFMLEDSGVPVVVTQRDLLAALPAHRAANVVLGETPAHEADVSRVRATAGDPAYLIYTSGSTGQPKGALNGHAAIVNRLLWMQSRYELTASDVVLQKTPYSFDVSVWELFWPLITGARLVMAEPGGHRDPAYLVDVIRRRNVTIAHFVPSMLRPFLAAAGADACTSLRHVVCSGEALPSDLVPAFYERFAGAELQNLYGPTEAAVDVTHWTCPRDFRDGVVPIGRPVANTHIYIVDGRAQPVPIGVAGELYIGGAQVGMGYHRRPELTAQKFVRDPFAGDDRARAYRTGDLARYRADGTIEYLGRLDTQVKLRGFRIELGEIETTLASQPEVADSVAAVRDAGDGDRRLVAYCVPADASASPADLAALTPVLRARLRSTLPEYMVPSAIGWLDAVPLTASGKIDRRALPPIDDVHAGAPATVARGEMLDDFVGPRLTNALHYELLKIWQDVLGVADVGIHDDFFDLGGHSLLAARAVDEISLAFGKPFPVAEFLKNPTVDHVARVFVEGMDKDASLPVVAVKPDGARAPFFFLDGDLSGGGYYVRRLARHLPPEQPFYTMHPHGTNARVFPDTIEAMALDYVDIVKQVRPEGPYVLGGFCSAALVAFEMARLLQERGDVVERVIAIDSFCTNGSLSAFADGIERVLGAAGIGGAGRLRVRTAIARAAFATRLFVARLRRSRTKSPADVLRWFRSRVGIARADGVDVGVADLEGVWRDITAKYIPRRYRGAVSVLLARPESDVNARAHNIGWRRVADAVDVHAIRGAHLTCITVHVDETAERLSGALEGKLATRPVTASLGDMPVTDVATVSAPDAWPQSWQSAYRYDAIEIYGDRRDPGYTYQYHNRVRTVLDVIRSVAPPGSTVLDVAAAHGNLSIALAHAGYAVTWNDIREELVGYVRLKAPSMPIAFCPGNALELPAASFDVVLACEVIEHVAHPDEFLKHLASLVRPGGAVVISTPNGEYAGHHLPRFSDCPDPSQYEAVQFGPGSDDHIFLLHQDELYSLAARAGLRVHTVRCINNPLTNGHSIFRAVTPRMPRALVGLVERASRRFGTGRLGRRVHCSFVAAMVRPQ